MARYTMMSEKDLNQFFGEVYDFKYDGRDPWEHFKGMLETIHIFGLDKEWNNYVDAREEADTVKEIIEHFRLG